MAKIGENVKLLKIAVTGAISAGKTTVCSFFKKKKALVIKCDKITHRLLSTDSKVAKKIVQLLGKDVIKKNILNKKKIAKKVFNDEEKLKKLENILHPLIKKEIKRMYEKARKEHRYLFFVVEIPLLFEMSFQNFFDKIILITAKKELRKKRYKKKDFEQREKRFMKTSQKIKNSDFIIKNNQNLIHLKKNINILQRGFL